MFTEHDFDLNQAFGAAETHHDPQGVISFLEGICLEAGSIGRASKGWILFFFFFLLISVKISNPVPVFCPQNIHTIPPQFQFVYFYQFSGFLYVLKACIVISGLICKVLAVTCPLNYFVSIWKIVMIMPTCQVMEIN